MFLTRIITAGLALGTLVAFSGCASAPPPPKSAIADLLDRDVGTLNESIASKIMAEPYHGNKRLKAKVEGEIDKRVWWWLRYFSVRERDLYERNLERGENYRPLIEQVLSDRKLPRELYYLAFIESGFVNHATSTTRAVGIWQFMKPTATNYGLKVAPRFDERTQPIPATLAAARYLEDLHNRYDSWYLAIAAFNAGPGRVNQAIRRGHTRDFWALANGHYLPEETMEYIPKFLAAATIGGHLGQFGFQPVHAAAPWSPIAAISLRPGISLAKISVLANMPQTDVLRYNPRLVQDLKTSRTRPVHIWLPRKAAQEFMKHAETLLAKVDP